MEGRGVAASVLLRVPYAPECVEGEFSELVCRMPHCPTHCKPNVRPESSRLLKVDHYMVHVGIKLRFGGWTASSQKADADTGVGGWQEIRPPVRYKRSGCPERGVRRSRFEDS